MSRVPITAAVDVSQCYDLLLYCTLCERGAAKKKKEGTPCPFSYLTSLLVKTFPPQIPQRKRTDKACFLSRDW
jgi:hypothetical protein